MHRQNITIAQKAVALAAMLAFLGCGLGLAAPWCVPQPYLFAATVLSSAVAGLGLGGAIRAVRERRALARSERE